MVNGSHGQSIALCLGHSFLLRLFPCFCTGSHSQDVILHELFSHQSLPWRAVLQEETAPARVIHGPQVLPENLLLHGVLSMGCCSLQESALAWAFQGLQLPSGSSTTGPVLHRLQSEYLLWHGLSWAAGKSLLRHPEQLLCLLLRWPCCLLGCFSHIFSLLSQSCCVTIFTLS